MGINFFFFFISPCACFSYAQWSFFKSIRKTVSKLSRSYKLLFAIKILMVSQFGDLQVKYAPQTLFWQLFQISLAVLRI